MHNTNTQGSSWLAVATRGTYELGIGYHGRKAAVSVCSQLVHELT